MSQPETAPSNMPVPGKGRSPGPSTPALIEFGRQIDIQLRDNEDYQVWTKDRGILPELLDINLLPVDFNQPARLNTDAHLSVNQLKHLASLPQTLLTAEYSWSLTPAHFQLIDDYRQAWSQVLQKELQEELQARQAAEPAEPEPEPELPPPETKPVAPVVQPPKSTVQVAKKRPERTPPRSRQKNVARRRLAAALSAGSLILAGIAFGNARGSSEPVKERAPAVTVSWSAPPRADQDDAGNVSRLADQVAVRFLTPVVMPEEPADVVPATIEESVGEEPLPPLVAVAPSEPASVTLIEPALLVRPLAVNLSKADIASDNSPAESGLEAPNEPGNAPDQPATAPTPVPGADDAPEQIDESAVAMTDTQTAADPPPVLRQPAIDLTGLAEAIAVEQDSQEDDPEPEVDPPPSDPPVISSVSINKQAAASQLEPPARTEPEPVKQEADTTPPQPPPSSSPIATLTAEQEGWLIAAGIPSDVWGYVDYIMTKESNWRPHLWNQQGSSAYGLCQRMMSVHKLQAGEKYMDDPVAQLVWCNDYAHRRYGGWKQSYEAWKKKRWW